MLDPAAIPPSDTAQDLGDPALARRRHELAGLEELADLSLAMCRRFQAAAIAGCDTAQTPQDMAAAHNYGRSFDRAARTYRQCLALKDRLLSNELARKVKAQALDEPEVRLPPLLQSYPILSPEEALLRRAPVREALTRIVRSSGRPPAEREALLADLNEFCDDPDAEVFRWGQIGNVIQRYCWAEKLTFDLDRFADTDWAKQEIAAQRHGSPYEGYRPKAETGETAPGGHIADPMARPP